MRGLAEIERALLRALRTPALDVAVVGRDDVLHGVHGEVHGGVEYGQPAVFGADSEGGWGWWGGFWGHVNVYLG